MHSPKQKIRKVVIPAAGYGTRLLPATKAQPKVMLPIVDKPVIQYVVEEAVASGIEDVIIVTGWQSQPIKEHFAYPYELEKRLDEAGKTKERDQVRSIAEMANFIYVEQKGPYGNATPVRDARDVIGDEPFAVLWGDEFFHASPPRLRQMIDVYEKYGGPVISAVEIPNPKDRERYGMARVDNVEPGVYQIHEIVEKPKAEEAPSAIATHGGYLFTPDIFPHLERLQPKNGELWLTDAINQLAKERAVYARTIENSTYYDTGSKFDYVRATVEFALLHEEIGVPFRKYLNDRNQTDA